MPVSTRIKIPAEVADLVRSLHPQIKRKVRAALDEILKESASGKRLHGELAAFRSFRVGKIRIIYREKDGILEIIAIGRREVIYYETTLILRQSPQKPECKRTSKLQFLSLKKQSSPIKNQNDRIKRPDVIEIDYTVE